MKRVFFIVSIIFLCGFSCAAQKTISEKDFEILVDYANCQYLMAFIEKNDAGKPYIADIYEKTVKPKLQKATLNDPTSIPNIKKIKELFPNGQNESALQLAKKIDERKSKYVSCPDDNSLIESLATTGWQDIDLTQIATEVQNTIGNKYNNGNNPKQISEQEVVRTQTIQTATQVEELKANISELQQQYNELKNDSRTPNFQSLSTLHWFVYILAALVFLIIVIIISIRLYVKRQFDKNKSKNSFEDTKNKSHSSEVSEKLSQNNEKKLVNLIFRLNDLEEAVGKLQERQVDKTAIHTVFEIKDYVNDTAVRGLNQDVKFFRTKNGKILQEELPNESGASFKIFNINNDAAGFEYCGSVMNPDFFAEICTFENNPADVPHKKGIITIAPGTVKLENNSWIIDKPAKIKFI